MIRPAARDPDGSRPMLGRPEGVASHDDLAPAGRPELITSVNGWPEGPRQLRCLNCGRSFLSESKAQRLCRSCR